MELILRKSTKLKANVLGNLPIFLIALCAHNLLMFFCYHTAKYFLRGGVMTNKIEMTRSENGNGEFYYLVSPKKSVLDHIWGTLKYVLKLPIRFFQLALGRLLSYLIINPLFRKQEKSETILVQNKKYPDPMLSEATDIVVLNVIPEISIAKRIFFNWWYHIMHFALRTPILSWLHKDTPTVNDYSVDSHLDAIVSKVKQLISSKEGNTLSCEKIHFKGLEFLSAEQRQAFFKKLQLETGHDFTTHKQYYNFFTLQTMSGAKLDSVEVHGDGVTASQSIESRKFIINCLPRSNNYHDWLKQSRFFANELNLTVIGFNYRGTGLSKGLVFNQYDIREDATAQVKRLLALGAKSENIALMGECLGANIATQAAAELHAEGCPVKIYNARSFRSLGAILLARVSPTKNASLLNPLTWIRKVSAVGVRYIGNPLLYSLDWDLSVDEAFKSIPAKDRGFLSVRSVQDQKGERYKDDTMIPHEGASIYSLVKEEQKRIQMQKQAGLVLSEEDEVVLADKLHSHLFYVSPVLRPDAPKVDGHTVQSRYLAPTYPENNSAAPDGREYAAGFFREAWAQSSLDKAKGVTIPL